eukprot:tig00000492_g1483.t1
MADATVKKRKRSCGSKEGKRKPRVVDRHAYKLPMGLYASLPPGDWAYFRILGQPSHVGRIPVALASKDKIEELGPAVQAEIDRQRSWGNKVLRVKFDRNANVVPEKEPTSVKERVEAPKEQAPSPPVAVPPQDDLQQERGRALQAYGDAVVQAAAVLDFAKSLLSRNV